MNESTMNFPDPAKLFTESAEKFTKFWSDFGANAGVSDQQGPPTPDSMRKMRDAFLKNLSGAYDEYLRSAEFTGQLSQMLQQGVRAQQRMSEMIGQARSSVQEASRQDVDAMMEVMQRLERRISDGFERMDERIDAIEEIVQKKTKMSMAPPPTNKAVKKATKKAMVVKSPAKKAGRVKATRKT